jgi:hypothetical protein
MKLKIFITDFVTLKEGIGNNMKVNIISLCDIYLDPKKMTEGKPHFEITKSEYMKIIEKNLPKRNRK